MNILVIEDDPHIADILRRGLSAQGFSVDVASDGEQGYSHASTGNFDLIILDLKLPKMSGNDVCRALRGDGITTPILMLTALSSALDIATSLETGANDYLTKPFDFGVLIERVQTLTGLESSHVNASIEVADLVLDTVEHTLTRNGEPVRLSSHEYMLLELFIANEGAVLTPQMICKHVWDINFDPRSNVVDSLVRFLQRKIDNDRENPLIETVPGEGYRFQIR